MNIDSCFSRKRKLCLLLPILVEPGFRFRFGSTMAMALLAPSLPRTTVKYTMQRTKPCLVRSFGRAVLSAQQEDSQESEEGALSSNEKNKKHYQKLAKKKANPPNKEKQTKKKLDNTQKKEVVAKAAVELRKTTQGTVEKPKKGFLDIIDPFKAGMKLRETIGSAITTLGGSGLSLERRSIYYLDDRFLEDGGGSAPLFTERNPLFDRLTGDDYVPEVLVVGATGEVGRLLVRRLLLDGRFRVRVLVRDLYSTTLNLLGTGVTYCQGDLGNVESLEYAVTDVDKIVFCAGAPRPDESDFQEKFTDYIDENLKEKELLPKSTPHRKVESPSPEREGKSDAEWNELEYVLELRSRLAEQVDCVGMQNLVRAYQNVRHADFGTPQAAKRSLFKFQKRPEDFNLFAIDTDGDEFGEDLAEDDKVVAKGNTSYRSGKSYEDDDEEFGDQTYTKYTDKDPYPDFDEDYSDDNSYTMASRRGGAAIQSQCNWIKNKFDHGVFVGKVPTTSASGSIEAAVVSSRLCSRDEPDSGIDLSKGFAGFVCRACADGGNYEAFVRTGLYESAGVEYICDFSTSSKRTKRGNWSKNKFTTIRLAFENFKPVLRKEMGRQQATVPPFKGKDIRQLGFRYRADSNKGNQASKRSNEGKWSSFYLALCYIKVYRSQPEPEFVYLSDARIPPAAHSMMIHHEARRIVAFSDVSSQTENVYATILDEAEMKRASKGRMNRSGEETYYKYRGEETLKNSGLSYAIIRVSGYNESPAGESSTIDLQASNDGVTPVSRADVAQVCVSALLDPNALNKSFYMSKTKYKSRGTANEEDISEKFKTLPRDAS